MCVYRTRKLTNCIFVLFFHSIGAEPFETPPDSPKTKGTRPEGRIGPKTIPNPKKPPPNSSRRPRDLTIPMAHDGTEFRRRRLLGTTKFKPYYGHGPQVRRPVKFRPVVKYVPRYAAGYRPRRWAMSHRMRR